MSNTEKKTVSFDDLSKEIINDPILFKKWFIKAYIINFNHKPEITFDEISDIMIGQNKDVLKLMKDIARVVSLVTYNEDLSDELFVESRNGRYCQMRRVTSYVMCRQLNFTVSFVGRMMSKNHATVIYHCKTVTNWLEVDKKFRANFELIMANLRASEMIFC